jgi:hypothetical protein
MTTPRAQLVELLQAVTPDTLDVLPYARTISQPPRTTVMVRVDEVTPSTVAPSTHREYGFVLVLIAGTNVHGDADVELDDALEDLLHAIDTAPPGKLPRWSSAKRGTYEDVAPAYEVTLTQTSVKKGS